MFVLLLDGKLSIQQLVSKIFWHSSQLQVWTCFEILSKSVPSQCCRFCVFPMKKLQQWKINLHNIIGVLVVFYKMSKMRKIVQNNGASWISRSFAQLRLIEPLYTLLSESSLVDFVSISHTAKRLPPKIRICLVCYQKEIWSKQHGSNWGLQESQIRHSFSQVSEIFQISVDLASFQLLEKLKKVCPWHVQACPSGNFPTFI